MKAARLDRSSDQFTLVRPETGLDSLYGFSVIGDGHQVIGESMQQLDDSEILAAAAELQRRDDPRALGSKILLMVIVDPKTVTLASSIQCSRSLMYGWHDGSLYFGGQIKALASLGFPLSVDDAVLPEYFTYRYVSAPRTLITGLRKLVGGDIIRIDCEKQASREIPYRFVVDSGMAESSITSLTEIMGNQIQAVAGSASHAGVLLSGGLDSGLIATVAKTDGVDFGSVSSSFDFANPSDLEPNYARSFAGYLGSKHHFHQSSATTYLEGLIESIALAEEPVHHLQSVMLYLCYRDLAKGKFDLLLSGEGADGLVGNHIHEFVANPGGMGRLLQALRLHWLAPLVPLVHPQASDRWRYLSMYQGALLERPDHLLWTLGRYVEWPDVNALFQCSQHDVVQGRHELITRYDLPDFLDRVSALSLLGEGAVSMSIWGKLAESQGIKVLYPFVAPELVDLITGTAWGFKTAEPKRMVRDALRLLGVPNQLVDRPKLSFGFPPSYWATKGGLLQPLVDSAGEEFGDAALKNLQDTDISKAMLLWSAVNLHVWKKLVIENVSPEELKGQILRRYQ